MKSSASSRYRATAVPVALIIPNLLLGVPPVMQQQLLLPLLQLRLLSVSLRVPACYPQIELHTLCRYELDELLLLEVLLQVVNLPRCG